MINFKKIFIGVILISTAIVWVDASGAESSGIVVDLVMRGIANAEGS